MSTETVFSGYTYEPCDPSEIPSRPRPIGPGRPSQNPHVDAVKAIAGSGEAFKFVVDDVDDDDERRKLINRHARYIRIAAHQLGRGARIGAERLEGGKLKIAVLDIPYVRRGRKDEDTDADE